ncbi:hypothetical protein MSG28_002641 [Choristoneura fumiferana]|uniref:Uncharacterized protein n=1 Tax=Choristoneura fumiferana TaxID=7141 RepID=A0ACC0JIN9_CHOFU|nr:hypothetical protein MSG28_002641 [Choristoneura fumiferana]
MLDKTMARKKNGKRDILSSSMEHLKEEYKLEAVRNVTDILSRTFSSQFVFPALGHNDPPPSRKLVDMWMQWLPTEALQTFETGGYYTIEQSHSKLRIVVLNSVLWAGGAENTDGPHRGRAQWQWLDSVLSKARRKNEMKQRYCRPVSWAFLAPSVTPRGAGSISNPGLRLYKFDSNNGKVLDYTQYYLDVTNRAEMHWAIEYNLTQYYGLRETILYKLTLFSRYLTALRVRHAPELSDCDSACVHVHYCAITRADYHEFRACVRNPASALASRASHNSAAILLYAILILISS